MNKLEFGFQMQRLIDTFDKQKSFYSAARMDSIWRNCEDLEAKDMQAIVNDFIDRLREKPTPDDFKKAAQGFKRHYPKLFAIGSGDWVPECLHCGDEGYLLVWYQDDESSRSICRCICDSGKLRDCVDYFIPQFSRELAQAFYWSKLPREWFPKGSAADVPEFMESKHVKQFMGRLRFADKFWRSIRDAHLAKQVTP